MIIEIKNAGPVITADLNVLGAAIKIIVAGGSALSEGEMKRASGASYYLWNTKGDVIADMVRMLEPLEA